MSKKNGCKILSALARILLSFSFVFGQTAWALQGQNGNDKPASIAATKLQRAPRNAPTTAGAKEQSTVPAENPSTEEHSPREGQHEGIRVHGHWTIEVRNPDGLVVTHREFENALSPDGANALSSLLSGNSVPGAWKINLAGSPEPCFESVAQPGGPSACGIVPSGASPFSRFAGQSSIFFSLTTSASSGQFVLSGTAIAGEVGNVFIVNTQVILCPATNTPPSCFSGAFSGSGGDTIPLFTNANLAQPLQVSAGQTIAVTVKISFS